MNNDNVYEFVHTYDYAFFRMYGYASVRVCSYAFVHVCGYVFVHMHSLWFILLYVGMLMCIRMVVEIMSRQCVGTSDTRYMCIGVCVSMIVDGYV